LILNLGEGQGREKDAKITIYKKTEDTYMLKLKTSREFYSKVSTVLVNAIVFFKS
jgi:hypothetical protein